MQYLDYMYAAWQIVEYAQFLQYNLLQISLDEFYFLYRESLRCLVEKEIV